MERHTWITHLDGSKTLVLWRDPVSSKVNVAMVSYPELTDEQVKEIMESKIERVQQLLAKHF